MEKFEKKRDRWWWWKKKEQESAEAISGLKICFCILAYKCTFMILRKILKKTFFKMPLKICKGPPFFTFLTFFPPMKNEKKIAWDIQNCILHNELKSNKKFTGKKAGKIQKWNIFTLEIIWADSNF